MRRLLAAAVLVVLTPPLSAAQLVVRLKNGFIAENKDRATMLTAGENFQGRDDRERLAVTWA